MSLMGIDIGTTGTKSIVFNEEGRILASDYQEYNLLFLRPGWVEFDTAKQWEIVLEVIRNVNSSPEVKKDPVSALSVSSYGEGFTPVDKNGNILYNTIYSTDARSIKELEFILTKFDRRKLFEITGYPPGYICPLNKILWFKNNRPDIYKKTEKLLFTDEHLYYLLGARDTAINYSLASRTLFFDVRKKAWSEEILSEFGIDLKLLSRLVPSGVEIGTVDTKVADNLGFEKNVRIISGCHDQPCAAFGVGAIQGGFAADGMGTVECVTMCSEEAITTDKMLLNNLCLQVHALKDKYVTLAYNLSSGSVVKWFRDIFADGDSKKIRELSSGLTYEPSRLMALPYFSATGTPYLDAQPKGSIIGIDLGTSKNEIFKALVESIVFEICFNIELAGKSGINVKELRATGGGAKSDYELLLKASILDLPILRMDITEAGCIGTMILAGTGTGKFTLDEALSRFIKVKDVFEPDSRIKEKYIEKYEKYKKIYTVVSQLF